MVLQMQDRGDCRNHRPQARGFSLDASHRYQTDDSKVLVYGPSKTKGQAVPRHAAPLSNIALTHIVIPKLPLAIGHAALKSKWAEAEVEKKWKESTFAKSRERSAKRKALNDFERFKVMRLRKRVSLSPQEPHAVPTANATRDRCGMRRSGHWRRSRPLRNWSWRCL